MVAAICTHSMPKEEEDLHHKESIPVPSGLDDGEWKPMFLVEFHRLVKSHTVETCGADSMWMEASDETN